MKPAETNVEYLDHEYVYAGTPANLRASGPYSVEAFFKLDSPSEDVVEAMCWLEAYKIPHEARIATNLKDDGFILRISFPLEESRSIFIREYPRRYDE